LVKRRSVRWFWWLIGSLLAAWPLIPWLVHLWASKGAVPARGWHIDELPGFTFVGVWVVDALGIDQRWALGGSMGSFLRHPIVAGHSTFLCAGLMILLAVVGIGLWARLIWGVLAKAPFRRELWAAMTGKRSQTALALTASFIGYGLLATLLPMGFTHSYLLVAFPIVHLSLAQAVLGSGGSPRRLLWGRRLLGVVCVAQLCLSIFLFHFLHVNGGAPDGLYGVAYRLQ
jgi:hypothetical protein